MEVNLTRYRLLIKNLDLLLHDDPFGEWITDCVLMATRLEPNNGQTAHTKLIRVDEREPLLNDLIRC